MADHGYDVADPRDVEPVFGDLAEFDALLAEAHALGLRVTIDLVPEPQLAPTTSGSRRRWPRPRAPRSGRGTCSARAAGPTAASRRTTGRRSSAARRGRGVPDGQWYLHIFAPEQPDLDFANPEVLADLEETMRFWLDRGVDGFRIDVAHGMAKPEGLPDMVLMEDVGLLDDHGPDDLRFDQDGVHDVHRRIRAVLDEYPGTMAVGEVWVSDDARLAQYLRDGRAAAGVQLQAADRRLDGRPTSATPSRTRWPRSPTARRRPAGCCPTTTGRGTSPATAAARSGCGVPGRPRCCSWPCRARSTSTTATSSACPTSTCPTRRCRTRSGSAPGTPSAAGTRAGSRCRGRATEPSYGFSTRARHLAAHARRAGRR